MTTITLPRATVEQALEALQWHYRQGHSNTLGGFRLKIDEKALRGLRAALAQQAEPVEPVVWVASKDGRVIYDDTSKDDSLLRVSGDFENDEQRVRYAKRIVDKLNAASAQQAEPVQEPVAWLAPRIVDSYNRPDLGYETCSKSDYGAFPAYTAPPQRTMVPLTEEEIDALPWSGSPRQFARAVEKASWEKNHG